MNPILILDFGSQFAHLIGNRVRRLEAYSEILPVDTPAEVIRAMHPAGIILSGGPQSVGKADSPTPDPAIFQLQVPILGICYGHQLIAWHFGGQIVSAQKEYGEAAFVHHGGALFGGVPETSTVWMNHGDSVTELPEGFAVTGATAACPIAAFEDPLRRIYAVQFHPEVTHSQAGMEMLKNFVTLCGAAGSWNLSRAMDELIGSLRTKVGERNVFMLVSGGVDSSVAFALLTKALGAERVYGLFIDSGLLRANEVAEVRQSLAEAGFQNLHVAEAADYFLAELAEATEPEAKRHAIGNAFLEIKRQWATKLDLADEHWLLGQGTIYPDHIETGGSAHASKIKTHHNRVPEIEKMIAEGRVIEPLADFYKDEVREIGRQLGLPAAMIERHPFPGPGLGVRVLCAREALPLAEAAQTEAQISKEYGLDALVLPFRSVGIQGDARSYRHPVALFSDKPLDEFLAPATRIPNSFPDLNRVLVALGGSQKPAEIFLRLPAHLTKERVSLLQQADAIVRQILREHDAERLVWQFPVVLIPIGFAPDSEAVILRPIQSENAMTATAVLLPQAILDEMTERLLGLPEISAVFLDLTSKPPGTIEWE
jgi:GMP synthase (glutamine-hydrolysing)